MTTETKVRIKPLISSNTEEIMHTNNFIKNPQKVFYGASAIHALAHWVPETRITTPEIEGAITGIEGSMLELERRAGMKEKRIHIGSESVLKLAMKAVEELKNRGTLYGTELPLDEIDLIIYFGITREFTEPATAVVIQKELGLNGPMAFDVTDACLGFTDALCISDSMIANNRIRYALLVSAEKLSVMGERAIEHINEGGSSFEQFASLTLADGAVAALIGPQSKDKNIINIRAGLRETHSEHGDLCIIKNFSTRMISFPREMFQVVLSLLPGMIDSVIESIGWEKEEIYKVIPHQASIAVVRKATVVTNIPMHKFILTFPEFGNIASVSLPFSLSMLLEQEKNLRSKKLMSFGFGSGLGFGILALETN